MVGSHRFQSRGYGKASLHPCDSELSGETQDTAMWMSTLEVRQLSASLTMYAACYAISQNVFKYFGPLRLLSQ